MYKMQRRSFPNETGKTSHENVLKATFITLDQAIAKHANRSILDFKVQLSMRNMRCIFSDSAMPLNVPLSPWQKPGRRQ